MQKLERNIKNNDTPKRVAIYVRASTSEQVHEWFWLESQERLLKALITANQDNGWITSDSLLYREEWVSGATPVSERPTLSRLKQDIYDKKFDILLVWRIDRLFRKVSYLLEFIDFLKDENINFVSKSENIDLSTHTWKLALAIFWAMAEAERETIAERTIQWKLSKAIQWYLVFWRYIPYGYIKEHDGKWYRLAVNPDEAKIVKEIFSLFVDEWVGTGEIARILTARNIGTNIDTMIAQGEKVRTKIHTGFFRQHNIARMIRNTAYMGEYACNKTISIKESGKMVQRPRDESEWVRIPCEAIIDKHTFQKAQALLDKSPILYRRWETHTFTGLVKCALCGRSFNYYLSHKKTGNYRCGGKKRDKVSENNICTNRDISEEKLLKVVWTEIEKFLKNPWEALQKYQDWVHWNNREWRLLEARKEIAKLDVKLTSHRVFHKDALRKELEWGENAETYTSIANDLTLEIRELENLKHRLNSEIDALNEQEEQMKIMFERSKEYKNKLEQIPEERKYELIRELVYQIQLTREKWRVIFNFEKK